LLSARKLKKSATDEDEKLLKSSKNVGRSLLNGMELRKIECKSDGGQSSVASQKINNDSSSPILLSSQKDRNDGNKLLRLPKPAESNQDFGFNSAS